MRTPWDELVEDLTGEARRRPPARAAWTGFALVLVLILALLLGLHFGAKAYAQGAPAVVFDCEQFASYARRMAMLRELGAQRDKVIAELRRDLRPGLMLAVLEREVKLVYAQALPRIEAEHGAYRRCQAQLGDMGREG